MSNRDDVRRVSEYVRANVRIGLLPPPYQHASLCVLDAVYSIAAKYESVDQRVKKRGIIWRYSTQYHLEPRGSRDPHGQVEHEDTLSDLVSHINAEGGPHEFAKNILHNDSKSPSVDRLKAEIAFELARWLLGRSPACNTKAALESWATNVDLDQSKGDLGH